MALNFGVLDHLDDNGMKLNELYELRLKLIELYDQAGFYAYHLTEHHATPLGMAPAPGIFLSAAIQRTKRLRFTTMIYILPLYDPVRLAEEICMLDQLSNGRFEVGVGRGISPYELAYFNISHLETQEIFREGFEVLIQALTNDSVTHKGERYTYRGTPVMVRPYQTPHPPFWYGPGNRASVEWCAVRGMNIVSNMPLARSREQLDQYREVFAREHPGKPLPKLGITRHLHLADTQEEAERVGRRAYRAWYHRYAYLWRKFDHRPNLSDDDAADIRAAADTAIFGTPETVRAELAQHVEAAGANYVTTRFGYGDLTLEESTRSLELFKTKVMPHFRDLEAAE